MRSSVRLPLAKNWTFEKVESFVIFYRPKKACQPGKLRQRGAGQAVVCGMKLAMPLLAVVGVMRSVLQE